MTFGSINNDLLDCEIKKRDIMFLAGYFDNVDFYPSVLGLSESEQVDVRKILNNQLAMAKCLSLWRRHNPSKATPRALLEILQRLRKEEIASKVCDYYHQDKLNKNRTQSTMYSRSCWVHSIIFLIIMLLVLIGYAYYNY